MSLPTQRHSPYPVAVKFSRLLVLGTSCVSSLARGDAPPIGGHLALGLRVLTTSQSGADISDDTVSPRLAADGIIGLRFGRGVVGLHGGIATPLRAKYFYYGDGGETGASISSTIYLFDVGLGAQFNAGAGFWLSAWLGATVALTRASSPAAHINAIDYFGDIPDASWSDHSMSLGYGAMGAYDFVANEYGRLAGFVAVESQGIGEIPTRYNNGQLGSEPSQRSMSLTVGAAYHF